ncbi:MAG: CRTAC1 family protein, partial [Thermoanaerobaculia bacterium]
AVGVDEPLWSTSAAFADVDRDGDLDLYVSNYLDFNLERHKTCREGDTGLEMYCHPDAYRGEPDRFFRNRGDGTFEEATAGAGFDPTEAYAGLGVVFTDVDGDGWLDLYVANDTYPNFLFRNRGDGTFEDLSLLSGAAFGEGGKAEAGMGVDAGDADGDGLLDLVVTNFERETNALYRNLGDGVFLDSRYPMGIAEASLAMLAFGVDFADLDQDGDLDLVVANGHVNDIVERIDPRSRYAQRNQLFENLGGRFREILDAGLDVVRPSRGLATGDLDGDGDLDLVIVNSNDLAEVYENLTNEANAFLAIDLVATASAPAGVGARVVSLAGGRERTEEVKTGSSYLSQNALSVHFGLAEATVVDRLTVSWPSGARQRFLGMPARRRLRVYEGHRAPRGSGLAQALQVGPRGGVVRPQGENPFE